MTRKAKNIWSIVLLLVLAVGFYAIWAGQAKAANLMPDFMENRIGYEIIDGTDQVEVCIFDGHWWSELPDAYTIPSQVTCTDAESPYYTQTFQVVGIQPRAFSEGAPSSEGQNVSITIEAPLTEISDYAFYQADYITSITLPQTVTAIGEHAFQECTALEELVIPGQLTEIGTSAFYGCENLAIDFSILDSVTSLGTHVFYECKKATGIADLSLLENETVGEMTFAYCSGLQKVILPDTVTSIGVNAFNSCTVLEEVNLPANLKTIGSNAFTQCEGLTTVRLPEGLETLGSNAFGGSALTSVTLPDTVTALGGNTFSNCTDVTSVILSSNLAQIGQSDFYGCTSLSQLTIPEGVAEIGMDMFSGCTSLTDVVIPDSVKTIDQRAFYGCNKLSSVDFGEGVETIGMSAFSGAPLTSVTLPASIKTLDAQIFYQSGDVLMGTPGSSPVKEATILATNAPEMSSNVFQYGETTIYVPKGATGYTGGYWDRYTIKTIEDTEPATEFTITTSRTDGCHLSYVCGDNSGELAANDSVLVPAGADVSFGVTNFVGYRIVDVKIDGVSQPLTSEYNFSYTFNDVDKNHSIAVTCEPMEEHEIAVPTAKTGLIYNGSEQIGVAEGTGYTLTGHKATNAGNYTATATLSSGYKWDDGTKTPKTITWSIAKKGVTFPTAGAGLVYNGQEQIGVPASTDGSYTLTNGKAVDAGSYEAAVTLVNTTNYQWADGIAEATRTITWTIDKAPAFALTGNAVIVKNQPDYTVEINLTKLANYPANTGNTPTFAVTDTEPYHGLDSATIDATGKLTLTADNTANETADSVNISLRDMKNYADSTITITVNYTDKAVVAISGITVAEKTYDGKAVAYTGNPIFTADGATVTPQGYSLTWENAAGEKLESAPKDAGSYKLIITIAESDPLYVGSAEVSCQIAKRPVSVMPKDISVKRNGNATFVLTYVGLVEGESLTPSVTPTFTLTDADKQEVTSADAVKTVGSYTITWSNMADTTFADAANYEVTKEATGTLTVKRPSGGGSLSGGSGSSSNDDSHDIQVEEDTANGKVEASTKDAESGDSVTITITPDEGYQLEKLTVTDADGKVLELKEAGDNKYTFTMPESEVEIKATFTEKADTGLPFLDVDTDDWYYEAAKYVYETGMMNGVDSTSFAPNASTTRGMIVAVLYRLEGSPAVSGSSFTDVAAGQYYADAVAWAAANEIVEGYDENTFAPADAVTREQLASILYRYAQFKGYDTTQGGMAIREFSDYTAISQWATEAMTWAINAELINGNENSALLPQGKATRAEVATMLMRFVTNLTTK